MTANDSSAPRDSMKEGTRGWPITLVVAGASVGAYYGLNQLCLKWGANDKAASAALFKEVPQIAFQRSGDAFFACFALHILNIAYENTNTKRQLALLAAVIKGIAGWVDWQIAADGGGIIFDSSGYRPLVIRRFLNYAITTPIIVYLVSCVSDFSGWRVAGVAAMQAGVIAFGVAASLLPSPWKWFVVSMSVFLYVTVLRNIRHMVGSALAVRSGANRENGGLQFIFIYTAAQTNSKSALPPAVVLWSVFPATWFATQLNLIGTRNSEIISMVANWVAKVVYSSNIMFSSFVTISERKADAQAVAEQEERVHMIKDLKEAMDHKDSFLSVMSHELRTPINGIMGLSDALVRGTGGKLNEKGQQFLVTINNSAHHLLNLVNDILDAAAFKHGKLKLKVEEVDIHKVVAQVFSTLSTLKKGDVQMWNDIDDSTPNIMADSGRVVQVLYNLLGNSLKFTSKGSVGLHVVPSDDKKDVLFKVQDTGIGIAEDKLQSIFVPFEQADMTTTRKYGGTGLGLSICKVLAEAHGGQIEVTSTPGLGSTFTVRLPIFPRQVKDAAPPPTGAVVAPPQTSPVLKIESASPAAAEKQPLLAVPETPRGEKSHKLSFAEAPGVTPPRSFDRQRPEMFTVEDQTLPQPVEQSPPPPVEQTLQTAGPQLPAVKTKGARDRTVSRSASFKGTSTPTTRTPTYTLQDVKPTHQDELGTILVLSVDDDPVAHMVLAEILEPMGYKLHCETDPEKALKWVNESVVLPDIVLLDCMMPKMNGHQFCAKFRETVPRSMVPVIMVSAKTGEANVVEGLRNGCNDFLSKPVHRDELLARMETHLHVKQDASWMTHLINSGCSKVDNEAMQLLKSILPDKIIARIQGGQKFIADSHQRVTVMFSDIVGFTPLSSSLPTAEVFMLLSNMFNTFDRLTDQYGVYKVETIGDAYMVVAGHDEDDMKRSLGTPAQRVLNMATAMIDMVKALTLPNGDFVRIRLGMHSGPAYAGVIGQKCPRYCFLGDTVNTASRMESNGFPMTIHLSEAAHKELVPVLGDDYFVSVGKRNIKGKGTLQTYLAKEGMWEEAMQAIKEHGQEAASVVEVATPRRLSSRTMTMSRHQLQVAALEDALSTMRAALETEQAQHLESQASIRQAQETIAAMQAQAAGQEENAKEQAAKLALLQANLEAKQQELKTCEARLETAAEKVRRMEAELEMAQRKVEEAQKQVQDAHKDAEERQGELLRLKNAAAEVEIEEVEPAEEPAVPERRAAKADGQRQRAAQFPSRDPPGQPQERPRSLSRPPARDEEGYLDDEGGEDGHPPRRFQEESSPPRNARAMSVTPPMSVTEWDDQPQEWDGPATIPARRPGHGESPMQDYLGEHSALLQEVQRKRMQRQGEGINSWPAGYGAYASSQPGNGGSVSPWGGKSNYTSASADEHLRGTFRAARDMAPTRHSPEGYGWEDADHERGPSPGRRGGPRPLDTMYDSIDPRGYRSPGYRSAVDGNAGSYSPDGFPAKAARGRPTSARSHPRTPSSPQRDRSGWGPAY